MRKFNNGKSSFMWCDFRMIFKVSILHIIVICFLSANAYAQSSVTVSGKVVDEMSNPVVGATIIIEGTSAGGTTTDQNGVFGINAAPNKTIIVSYVGYQNHSYVVKSQVKDLIIKLAPEVKLIDDVVVIGYGVRKKISLTGAVSSIGGQELSSKPFPSVSQALQGRIPGLTVTRNGGAPGAGATFNIRGISSLNGGSPLVLVDGAETQISVLNTADIESISVLKDASAAIYGARASDGVILVTTKSGKKGGPVVELNAYYAIKKPSFVRETVSLYEYVMMGKDAASDGSVQPGGFGYEYYTDEDLQKVIEGTADPVPGGIWSVYPKFYQNQNWYDQLIKNGTLQNYNINVSGGGERATYMVSGEFQNEGGIVNLGTDKYDRYNLRSKVNINLMKNLILKTNISYSVADRNTSVSDYFFGALNQMRCWAPIYNPQDQFYRFQNYPQAAQTLVEGGSNKNSDTRINTDVRLEYEVIPGLKLIGSAAINNSQYYAKSISRAYDQYDWDGNVYAMDIKRNGASNGYTRTQYRNYSGIADFNRTFAEKHSVNALVGVSQEQQVDDNFNGSRNHFPNNELFELALGDPEFQYSNGWGSNWAIRSVFSRIGYSYDNRYILDATFRYDGTSRFHKDHRWGFFPGVSVAWNVAEEKFLKNKGIFDQLKLRLSVGEVGNQSGIGLYDYYATIVSSSGSNGYYPFGNGAQAEGKRPGGMVSLARTWETIRTNNIGIDIITLNNRLSASFDYFDKRNNSMLVNVAYPSILGLGAPATNDGKLKITGFEAVLSWRDKIGKDFSYGITATLSDAKNKIVYLSGADSYVEGLNSWREGYSTNTFFGFVSDGYIQSEQELIEYKKYGNVPQSVRIGDMKYRDVDGDGNITPYGDGGEYKGDMVLLGDMNPRYNYGINIDMAWKGIDLSMFFQGVGKRMVWLEGINGVPYYEPWYDPAKYFYGNTWAEDNRNAKYPRLTFNSDVIRWNYKVSDQRLVNAAYLRLKNIQIGYTLPKKFVEKLRMQKFRVYFSGSDLFEFDQMPGGYDPEDPKNAAQYPFTRFYSFGANITF